MFIVVLRFSSKKDKAGDFMDAHKAWIARGFDDSVFLLVGSLQPSSGGTIIAHNTTLPDLQARVNEDPFVAQDIVTAEVLEIAPARTDERLAFING